MKYLYRILRLFFCSHKYEIFEQGTRTYRPTGHVIGTFYISKCRYCGKIKSFEKRL